LDQSNTEKIKKIMPYTHRKVGDKQCVYKKDGGAKVGCTSGSIKKYLAALYINADESVEEEELINENTKNLIKRLLHKNLKK